MMECIIYGGSFNPVHIGHLHMADEVAKTFSCDRVIFVPAAQPPHKEKMELIDAQHRLRMLTLAVMRSNFIVDDCEIRRGGLSYTIDTVKDIIERYRLMEKPGLLLGDDLLDDFSSWKDAEGLSRMTNIILVHRGNRTPSEFPYDHIDLENLLVAVSSSDIRNRIREGKAYQFLLPRDVYDYIEAYGLCRHENGTS